MGAHEDFSVAQGLDKNNLYRVIWRSPLVYLRAPGLGVRAGVGATTSALLRVTALASLASSSGYDKEGYLFGLISNEICTEKYSSM